MHSPGHNDHPGGPLPRPDGGVPFALVSDDGDEFWELTSLLRWPGGSDMEAISFARAVLVDRGATLTERHVRHYRAATGEPAA